MGQAPIPGLLKVEGNGLWEWLPATAASICPINGVAAGSHSHRLDKPRSCETSFFYRFFYSTFDLPTRVIPDPDPESSPPEVGLYSGSSRL